MNLLLFGATGMIGSGVLSECLRDSRIRSVLVIGRSSCGVTHEKVCEIIYADLYNLVELKSDLAGAGKSEAEYRWLTYDITLAAAKPLAEINPGMTFCYISAQGADSSENGGAMWARIKGATENALFALNLNVYAFRPGLIVPSKGLRARARGSITLYMPCLAQLCHYCCAGLQVSLRLLRDYLRR